MNRSLLPNPSLVAILLVVRTASGPSFVFHYPQHPTLSPPAASTLSAWRSTDVYSEDETSSDEDSDSSSIISSSASEDDLPAETASVAPTGTGKIASSESDRRSRSYVGRSRRHRDGGDESDSSGEDMDRNGKEVLDGKPWERVFGLDVVSLATMLAPGKEGLVGKKFELGIEDLVFLGYPLGADSEGYWSVPRRRRYEGREDNPVVDGEELDGDLEDLLEDIRLMQEADEKRERLERGEKVEPEKKIKSRLMMFNVVFVLNPPILEYQARVQDMLENVVKRFSETLRIEQARTDYIYQQKEKITRLRDKAAQDGTTFHELWTKILAKSDLAAAIAHVYDAISTSRIAHFVLNKNTEISLQIPVITSTALLPSLNDPPLPGLHLTTAEAYEEPDFNDGISLARHFTLLFLEPVDSILAELEGDTSVLANLLRQFLPHCKSTLSFVQLSQMTRIPLSQIESLAQHLIYWRRARPVPPLHWRDTYVVSPSATFKKLVRHAKEFAEEFPSLPGLIPLLESLAGKPKMFSSVIPSREDREIYLIALEWLLRYNYVTQLRTFAYLKIDRDIKIRAREREKESEKEREKAKLEENGIPEIQVDKVKEKEKSLLKSKVGFSDIGITLTLGHSEDEEINSPSYILEPLRPSPIEEQWLQAIEREFFATEEVRVVFRKVLKYLDGRNALEKIAVREGLHRRDVRRILAALEGLLVIVRHW